VIRGFSCEEAFFVPFFGKKAQKHEACQGFASCFAALPQSASWREAPLHVPTARFIYHFSPLRLDR
jgi:hypothetical protein